MSSKRRRAASRANGKKSRGPVTPEGKARSAANSTRHGLASANFTAASVCLFNEVKESYEQLYAALFDEHQPATATECLLIEEMAVARWRQQRIWVAESGIIDKEMCDLTPELLTKYGDNLDETLRLASSLESLADNSNALGLLLRYEARLSRQFERCLQRFLALRELRLRDEPNPRNEHCHAEPETQSNQSVTNQSPVAGEERRNARESAAPPPSGVPPVPHPVARTPDRPESGLEGDFPRAA
ncbi:MAG: hypothetical protein IT162_08855 [Bryobacterales bacterium]|nr:hypothetical protein [Bryobacterales bacterium]